MSTPTDPHVTLIRSVSPWTPEGCGRCLRLGSAWVHLRLCLTCGHVGCCDSSPLRHARGHAYGAGTTSCSPSSRARTGAGAMSTKPTSDRGAGLRDRDPGAGRLGRRQPVAETPDLNGAYPRLSDAQIAALSSLGQRASGAAGRDPVRRGRPELRLLRGPGRAGGDGGSPRDTGGTRHQRARPGPLPRRAQPADRRASYYSAVPVEPGEVLVVPADRLRRTRRP